MICSNCGKEIEETVKFCPFCGANVEAKREEATPATEAAAPEAEAAPAAEATPAAETAAPASEATPATGAATSAAEAVASFSNSTAPEEPVKAKKKGKGIAIAVFACIAVVLLIVGGIVIFAKDKMGHAMHKAFDSPKDYYVYLEKKNVSALAEAGSSESYQKVMDMIESQNNMISETIKVKLGSRGKDFTNLAKTLANVDLSWLDSVGISYVGIRKDSLNKFVMSPILNDVTLASAIALFDAEEGNAFISFPELSEKYIGIDFGEYYKDFSEKMEEMYAMSQNMIKAYPNPEEIEEFVLKYYQLIMDQVDKMQKEKATLEAGDVTQDCTVLTMDLDSEDIKKILSVVVKELQKDKDLERFVTNYCESLCSYSDDLDKEEIYNDFYQDLEDFEESIDSIEIEEVVIEAYVDGDGKIIGRIIKAKNEDDSLYVKYVVTRKGDKAGIEFTVQPNEDEAALSIIGNGTEKNDKFNGDFEVTFDEKSYLRVDVEDYDLQAAKNGGFAGSYTFKAGSDVDVKDLIQSALGRNQSSPIFSLVSSLDPQLRFSGVMTLDSHDLTLTLLDGSDEIVSFILEGTVAKGEDITIPDTYLTISADGDYDEEKLVEYIKSLKYDVVLENLKKANLPEEWISELEEQIEDAMDKLEYYYN